MSRVANAKTISERPPFDVDWQTIDGLKIRYATGGNSGERIVLFSPWPESIFAFAPVWSNLVRQFQMLAFDLPGFGRSEGRDDLFTPQTMGDFIVKAIDAFGVSRHTIGLDVGTPSLLFASVTRPDLLTQSDCGRWGCRPSTPRTRRPLAPGMVRPDPYGSLPLWYTKSWIDAVFHAAPSRFVRHGRACGV